MGHVSSGAPAPTGRQTSSSTCRSTYFYVSCYRLPRTWGLGSKNGNYKVSEATLPHFQVYLCTAYMKPGRTLVIHLTHPQVPTVGPNAAKRDSAPTGWEGALVLSSQPTEGETQHQNLKNKIQKMLQAELLCYQRTIKSRHQGQEHRCVDKAMLKMLGSSSKKKN